MSVSWVRMVDGHREAGTAEHCTATAAGTRRRRDKDRKTPMPKQQTSATPVVRRTAQDLGVDLAAVAGTGAGGRITLDDVRAAAGPAAVAAASAREARASMVPISQPAPSRRFLQEQTSWLAGTVLTTLFESHPSMTVNVDAYALNPLLDDLRQADAALYRSASAGGPPPSLFGDTGLDLPVFTASGFDPVALLRLPWQARHAAASATSQAEVKRIFDQCAGGDLESAVALAGVVGMNDPGNGAYRSRMHHWALYGGLGL